MPASVSQMANAASVATPIHRARRGESPLSDAATQPLNVVNRYLIKELAKSLLSVTLVLMLIYLSSRLAVLLAQVAAGELAGDVVFSLLFLKSITNLALVSPPALFIAVLLTMGRMYRDNEITVLNACGAGYGTLYRGLLYFTVPVVLLLAVLSFVVGPWADASGERVKQEAEQRADVSGISAGRFKESDDGAVVFYTEALDRDNKRYRDVFIQSRRNGRLNLMMAKSGQERTDPETGDRYLVLEEGSSFEGDPGAADYTVLDFQQYAIRINERDPQAGVSLRKDSQPTLALIAMNATWAWAELHTRLALPVSALLLALLALPLSYTSPRQGRYSKLFLAIFVYVVYANILVMAETWLSRGVIPLAAGMWWVHAGVLLLWLVLQMRRSGYRLRRGAA